MNSCCRHINSISSPFSIVFLFLIELDHILVIFVFVRDGICDIGGKVGCHMKIFLTICACLHGLGVNIDCIKVTGLFWFDCWNIFVGISSCLVLMQILYMNILE